MSIQPPLEQEKDWTENNRKFDLNDPAIKAQMAFVQAWLKHSGVEADTRYHTFYRAQKGKPKGEQVSYSFSRGGAYTFLEDVLDGKGEVISRKFPVSQIINTTPFVGYAGRASEDEVIRYQSKD